MTPVMLACGHAANAVAADGTPACAVCVGIHPDARTVVPDPDLAGRVAHCSYHSSCRNEQPSRLTLPFFEYRQGQAFDRYYCGCWGWD